jgi:hypothetical protein
MTYFLDEGFSRYGRSIKQRGEKPCRAVRFFYISYENGHDAEGPQAYRMKK